MKVKVNVFSSGDISLGVEQSILRACAEHTEHTKCAH